ncbi:MAG TPA: hypothetical protein VFB45_22190 [Pseudolabrys sp.]|nr:hypothetical protein [Pseudolabrys sp.]
MTRQAQVDRERLARLLGLSDNEFLAFIAANLDGPELLAQRLQRCGFTVDQVAQVEPDFLRMLCINCNACAARAQCMIGLNGGPDDSDADDWRDYCGNVGLLSVVSALLACSATRR